MKTPLNFLKYHPQSKLETKCPLQPQRRDREEGWSNCSSRLPSHLTLDSSMALPSPQVGMLDLVETNNIWQKSLFLLCQISILKFRQPHHCHCSLTPRKGARPQSREASPPSSFLNIDFKLQG